MKELFLEINTVGVWKFPTVNRLSNLTKFTARECDLKIVPENFIGKESDTIICKSLTEIDLSRNFIEELPPNFIRLQSLTTIKLRSNLLETFPAVTLEMKKVEELDLANNRIQGIPVFFKKSLFDVVRKKRKTVALAKALKRLNLSNNLFDSFPAEIEALNKLEEFDISNNNLRDTLNQCELEEEREILGPNIRVLKMEHCGMTTFPQVFFKVPQMQHLNLARNKISELPKFNNNFPYMQTLILDSCSLKDLSPIFPMKLLRTLHASDNQIRTLPQMPTHSLNSLADLRLNNNKLEIISSDIANYTALTHLELSHNVIETVDSSICKLSLVKHLDLSHNRITQLPQEAFMEMKAIQKLDLSHNYDERVEDRPALAQVPSLTKCTKLRELSLNDNLLRALPEGMNRLTSLTKLDASRNMIQELDAMLYQCCQLEELDLSYNLITTLNVPVVQEFVGDEDFGQDISNLISLVKLDISHNEIQSIPEEYIAKLEDLKTISMQGNLVEPTAIKIPNVMVHSESHLPYMIIPGIYMPTSSTTSYNSLALKKSGITHVLDVSICKKGRSLHLSKCRRFPGIQYKMLYLGSSEEDKNGVNEWERMNEVHQDPPFVLDLWQLLAQTNKYLDTVIKQGGSVYIAGDALARDEQNAPLSLLLVITYLMYREKMTRRQALAYVRDRTGCKMFESSGKQISKLLCHLRRYDRTLKELEGSLPPIKQILLNDTKRAYFRKFCQKEQSMENIGFWEEVERRYKCQSDPARRIPIAEDIYRNFLVADGRYSLNINRKMAEKVKRKLLPFTDNLEASRSRNGTPVANTPPLLPVSPYIEDSLYDSDGEGNRVKESTPQQESGPTLDLFDPLMGVIEKVMVDTETRFRTSDLHQKMLVDAFKIGRNPQTHFLISRGDDIDSDESDISEDESDDEDESTETGSDVGTNSDIPATNSIVASLRPKFTIDLSNSTPQQGLPSSLSARKRSTFSLRIGQNSSPRGGLGSFLTKKTSQTSISGEQRLR